MDLSRVNYQPVDNEILIQELHRREQHRLMSGTGIAPEEKPEDYLIRGLIDFNDISYDDQAELLYKLAAEWCIHATKHGGENGGKPWTYLLIPHDVITDNKTLKGLAASYIHQGKEAKC